MPYVNDRMYDAMLAENVNLRARMLELEQEQTALWHSLNTMSEYVETLEAQLAEATAWVPVADFDFTPTDGRPPVQIYPTEMRVTNNGQTLIFAMVDTEYEIDFKDKRLCRVATPASVDMEADDA